MNTNKSSKQVASLAATTLQDPSASKTARTLAGSVLAQSSTNKQTGADLEEKASKVLRSSKYSEDTKTLAGSVLSQSNKKR
ncbi:hypothetical protein SD909_004859 [Vibrio parahaemolyticus]|nr:hypothetical protein [Vibrio parahaemolyticus]ELZ1718413.1 hypothetical protein [Vibrio parahaemolyticus]